ncbi:hypothetical protein EDC04DRAFT_1379971 [Pisolithus marmoratus]|nr:hypothetical protein EDC04DRAFT_1379971 [Pisolithus marmoratus]
MVSMELHEGSQSQVGIQLDYIFVYAYWTFLSLPFVSWSPTHWLYFPASLTVGHLNPILASLESELSLVEPRITAYLSGLSLLPVPSELCAVTLSLEHLESCLRLVDSFLLGQWSTTDLDGDPAVLFRAVCVDGLASKVLSLCVLSQAQLRESESEDQRTLCEWTGYSFLSFG